MSEEKEEKISVYLYREDHQDGKVFPISTDPKRQAAQFENLTKQGWVDTPAKLPKATKKK